MSDSSTLAEARSMSRREFTLQSALAVLSGCVITVAGCGSDSPSAPAPAAVSDVAANITANHGHSGTITSAQITAGNILTLDIRGSANHPHTVEITQAELTSLRNRQPVTKASSTDSAHQHSVTFSPA